MLDIILPQPFQIRRAAAAATDTVQIKNKSFEPQAYVKLPGHVCNLSVEGGIALAYCFKSELMMLSVSSRLWTFISKDCGIIVESHGLREAVHSVFDIRTANRGSPLGTQGQLASAPVFHRIHLFLYDVGLFTDTSYEEASVLESRCIYSLVAIELAEFMYLLPRVAPVPLFTGQNVRSPTGRSIQGDPPLLPASRCRRLKAYGMGDRL
jgi:hypothetical protein